MRFRVNMLVNGFCGEHERERLESQLAGALDITDHEVCVRRDGEELVVAFSTSAVLMEDAVLRAGALVAQLREPDKDVQVNVRRIRQPRSSSRVPAGQSV